jgi:hypothetical protein
MCPLGTLSRAFSRLVIASETVYPPWREESLTLRNTGSNGDMSRDTTKSIWTTTPAPELQMLAMIKSLFPPVAPRQCRSENCDRIARCHRDSRDSLGNFRSQWLFAANCCPSHYKNIMQFRVDDLCFNGKKSGHFCASQSHAPDHFGRARYLAAKGCLTNLDPRW